MKDVAKRPDELSVEERNLLSVAYKNAVGSRRASWRIVSSVEQKEQSKGNSENRDLAQTYRIQVEKELDNICQEILDLLKLLDDRKNEENGGRLLSLHCRIQERRRAPRGRGKSQTMLRK